jgi:hypothetical protein
VARLGDGWFGLERGSGTLWAWSRGRSSVTFDAWPRRAAAARLEFRVRSLSPRVVIARQNGREIWRGSAGADLSPTQSVPVRLEGGRGTVAFETDSPGVPEGPGAGARLLSFALYEPRLIVEPP